MLGLCVSGGPDSMALAFLFQQLRELDMAPDLDLTALIVDHGNRSDSAEEALTVSTWLKDLSWVSCDANVYLLTLRQISNPRFCN